MRFPIVVKISKALFEHFVHVIRQTVVSDVVINHFNQSKTGIVVYEKLVCADAI